MAKDMGTGRKARASVAPSYCDVARGHPIHGPFHDREHGFPLTADAALFERLVLEINQAGLSWLTVLRKRAALKKAFADYELERVARLDARARQRLLGCPGIVRHRGKIDAVIENAHRLIGIKERYGGFARWLDAHHPLRLGDWVKLFGEVFVFTGPKITEEFLVGTGYLPGAHQAWCPVYELALRAAPPWSRTGTAAGRKAGAAHPARAG